MIQTMLTSANDPQALRRCMRELTALSTLSAAWGDGDAAEIADSLANALCRALPAELVYVRVKGEDEGVAVEAARTHKGRTGTKESELLRKKLEPLFLAGRSEDFPNIANPLGDGILRAAIIPIGYEADCGVLVAGSQNPDFPSDTDQLLLSVAANQAAVVLQRQRSEEAVRRSARELNDFFDNAAIGLHWVSPQGIILRANRAELNLLGYSESEYIGRHIAEFHADKNVVEDMLKRLHAGEELQEVEARMVCKDGSIKYVLISSNVFWQDGRFIHTRCFTRDITKQKHTERMLSESEERFRRFVHATSQVTWTAEPNGQVVKDSASWRAFTGQTYEEWRGWGWLDAIHPNDRDRAAQLWRQSIQDQSLYQSEYRLRRPDGSYSWMAACAVLVREANGLIREWVATNTDITERKRAEQALRENERRFREIIDALPAAIYTTDAQGRITYFNPACVELSGRVPEIGSDQWCVTWKLYYPDGKPMPHDECPMAIALKEGRTVRGAEAIAERPDGSRIWFTPYPTPLRDLDGRIIGGVNMLVDTTERKRAEETRARLAAIVESCGDAIISKDLNSIIKTWNKGAEQIFGYCAAEAIGQPITILMPPDRVNEESGILERIRRGEKVEHYETVRRRKDGSLLDISLSVSPITDASGKVIGASKIARDVTERKRAADRLGLLWEAAEVLLSTDDPDKMLRQLFVRIAPHFGLDTYFNFMVEENRNALRLASCIGVPEHTAQSISQLPFGEAICGTVALHRQPIHATHIQESEDPKAQLVKSLGIRAYACNPLLSTTGELVGTLSFASRSKDGFDSDELAFLKTICHYVAVAHERIRLVNQLKEIDRRKDEFLATLAHELRNPLAPIKNAIELLHLKPRLEPELAWARDLIDRQTRQLNRLVDDLLDVSRITRDKIELRKEHIAIKTVVESAIETSRPLIEAASHELTMSIPEETLLVDADPVRLAQVVSNLLNNAAKYTEEGGKIIVTVGHESEEVFVSVKDNGVGIPEEMLPRVFDMFTQIDRSLNRSQGGLGIGLTLVRNLMQMHGGRVEAHSAGPGKGSEFVIRLPMVKGETSPSENGQRPAAALPFAGQRVLAVDDNRDAADSLGTLLVYLGADARVYYDGPSALAAMRSYRPTTVLLDLGLPGMDGYEIARRIRSTPEFKDVTIIALSGWGQEDDRRRTQTAGFDHHLVKPVDAATLKELLSIRKASGN